VSTVSNLKSRFPARGALRRLTVHKCTQTGWHIQAPPRGFPEILFPLIAGVGSLWRYSRSTHVTIAAKDSRPPDFAPNHGVCTQGLGSASFQLSGRFAIATNDICSTEGAT